MFFKEIEFLITDKFKDQYPPIPATHSINNWYKKLKYSITEPNIKGCIPFREAMSAGYIIRAYQDFSIKHNFYNEKIERKDTAFKCPFMENAKYFKDNNINVNHSDPLVHGTSQLENSDYNKINSDLPFYKIANPYVIKTPKGYSCLIVPPLNNYNENYEIFSGIVDTDSYPLSINFPFFIKSYEKEKEITIKAGDPIAQIIPFKRTNWKMKINKISNEKNIANFALFFIKFLHNYRDFSWFKKIWK